MLVDPSVRILRVARSYVRGAMPTGRVVKPIDSVHLATAVQHRVDTLLTYEEQSRRAYWAEITGLAVEEPSVDQMPML